ncbi:hypothetical protein B2I21_03225 [Chryseobacterium mucoviscidosis]|nr:hypothetical protein B2I21_03225 [Chryseobacterium mucoviscidosis]
MKSNNYHQQMRKERIEHILNSALQTMAKCGIDLTNIKDIAKEANLSVGNFIFIRNECNFLQ